MNAFVSSRGRQIRRLPLLVCFGSRCDRSRPFLVRRITQEATTGSADIKKTRNIGIIAHIDAGKTTTTERMLYYSGFTRRIGDVDEGSTVTDFLPAERARGITIQSAAVTFLWNSTLSPAKSSPEAHSRSRIPHTINLIDTPGHADFTFEVLRSLRILDGAVCVLDGVAGVEAQTEKVWSQANKYSIPRIAYVNKLDRDGAAFGKTVREIGSRLRGWPAVCQIPWWKEGNGAFIGVGDAVELCALRWEEGGDGKSVHRFSLSELDDVDERLATELRKARSALVECLCEIDEKLLTRWLECNDDTLAIPAQDIKDSLRRCILPGTGNLIPVFAGASFRNIGVQPLLDAVNDLLPDPTERPDPEISAGKTKGSLSSLLNGSLQLSKVPERQVTKRSTIATALAANIEACALAFKVVNDPRRGVLVYIRVYSGVIKRNAALWNTNLHVTERAQRLLQMYASDALEISSIPAGQIGVIVGLKHARTGDTLVSYPGANPKTGPPAPLNDLQLRPIDVPPPVFFAAIEPHSLSEEKNVKEILALLLREDPSLHVTIDEESGQMLLSGMGELHLEIARDRLIGEFKAKASMGNIEIGYRECVLFEVNDQHFLFDREILGKKGKAGCAATVSNWDRTQTVGALNAIEREGNLITVVVDGSDDIQNGENQSLPPELDALVLQTSLVNGAAAALARGPRRAFPLHNVHVILKFSTETDFFGSDTSLTALANAARLATQTVLKKLHDSESIGLMEPVMNVTISCDEASLGPIVHDLSSARGGHVLSLGEDDDHTEEATRLDAIDESRIYTPPDPFAPNGGGVLESNSPGQQRTVKASVPLKEMVGYLKHLRSLTGGRGTFVMSVDRFERISGPREREV